MTSKIRAWLGAGLLNVVTIGSILGAIGLSSVAQAAPAPIDRSAVDRSAVDRSTPDTAGTAQTKQEPFVRCRVVGIRTGQLALRFSPNGESRAGLNNGNIVDAYQQQGIWFYVRVVSGPNSRVTGLEGWVNSSYLSCND